ncbi:MAG: hypothetical protein J5733_12450 [Bacteroidaceae bacterium]|nr:hypothetical protein [Bacteroidaceae bacterium]
MSTATLSGLRDYLYSTLSPADMIWLGTQLTEHARKEEHPITPYTMEEINARLDLAEAEIAAGIGTPHEDMMREWEEELAREEQAEHDFAEAV